TELRSSIHTMAGSCGCCGGFGSWLAVPTSGKGGVRGGGGGEITTPPRRGAARNPPPTQPPPQNRESNIKYSTSNFFYLKISRNGFHPSPSQSAVPTIRRCCKKRGVRRPIYSGLRATRGS